MTHARTAGLKAKSPHTHTGPAASSLLPHLVFTVHHDREAYLAATAAIRFLLLLATLAGMLPFGLTACQGQGQLVTLRGAFSDR